MGGCEGGFKNLCLTGVEHSDKRLEGAEGLAQLPPILTLLLAMEADIIIIL